MPTGKQRVSPALPDKRPWAPRVTRAAINAFLIFHLVGIICWSMPLTNPLLTAGRNLIRPYFLWAGLFQSWDMFSPTPRAINSYIEAIVLYKDGTTKNWVFPRMDRLSLTERYFKERYRKFAENLFEDTNSALWPDAARRIARLNATGQSEPAMVFLVRYSSPIVPQNEPHLPAAWDSQVFYAYTVEPGDVK
ncbi:MAG TPA: hypothetical protein VKR43_24435 [Bryobacteraceae bacterium]|nr:hypothetical protein [Bryobacteraceae bacterium]